MILLLLILQTQIIQAVIPNKRSFYSVLHKRHETSIARGNTIAEELSRLNSEDILHREGVESTLLVPRGGGSRPKSSKKTKKKPTKSKTKNIPEKTTSVPPAHASSIVNDIVTLLKTTIEGISSLINSLFKHFFDYIFDTKKKHKKISSTEKFRTEKSKKISRKKTTSTKKKEQSAPKSKQRGNTGKSSTHRIQSELKKFVKNPPDNLSIQTSAKNIRIWIITLKMPSNTIYANEKFRLKIIFPNQYPTIPPSVFFLQPTPRHEHVYTNGDICLSLLGKDWRPTMTAQSLALSIFSILCSAREKSLPMDNAKQAGMKPGQAQDNWVYHDDNC